MPYKEKNFLMKRLDKSSEVMQEEQVLYEALSGCGSAEAVRWFCVICARLRRSLPCLKG